MALYVLVADASVKNTQSLTRLPSLYPDHRVLADNVWIVRSTQNTHEISDALFPREENKEIRHHVIFRVDAWWGWNDRAFWEWLGKPPPE